MEFYSELIEDGTNKPLGYVKVVQPNVNDMGQSVVTTDGNHFFTLSGALCHLRPIVIDDDMLQQVGFVKGTSNYLIQLTPNEVIYQKLYSSGWFFEVLYDGQNYYYLEPKASQTEGCIRHQVTTIEQLQSEVAAYERKKIVLPLLNTILNKQKLKNELMATFTGRYVCYTGGSNGMYVDNDQNRPDYNYLTLDPIDPNADPAVIGLNQFNTKGCTVNFNIEKANIQCRYGMSFQDIVNCYPQHSQIISRHQRYLMDLFYRVNKAIEGALTC